MQQNSIQCGDILLDNICGEVRLTPREPVVADPAAFLQFASLAFGQKRNTLRNNLRAAYPAIDAM